MDFVGILDGLIFTFFSYSGAFSGLVAFILRDFGAFITFFLLLVRTKDEAFCLKRKGDRLFYKGDRIFWSGFRKISRLYRQTFRLHRAETGERTIVNIIRHSSRFSNSVFEHLPQHEKSLRQAGVQHALKRLGAGHRD